MGKRRNDDADAGDGITLLGLYRYMRWLAQSKADRPDPRVWLVEGADRDRLVAQDRAWSADPCWRRRKVGPTIDVLRLELNESILLPVRSIDIRPAHPNEAPGERMCWPEAADFVRQMRAEGVHWCVLTPDDRVEPVAGGRLEIDPSTFWGEDQQPHVRFPFPRHPDGVPIVEGFPRGPSRL